MKKLSVFCCIIILLSLYGCGEDKKTNNDDEQFLKLKIRDKGSIIKILTGQVGVDSAYKFSKKFRDTLIHFKGKVLWPIDDSSKNHVRSWSIDMRYIKEIDKELNQLKHASDVGLRFYPVINDRGAFSIMVVGGYKQGGKTYILKYKVDSAGNQGNKSQGDAPMYEWLDPCPPFDCPQNDF